MPYLCSKFEPLGNKLAQAREWKMAAASFVAKYLDNCPKHPNAGIKMEQ